MATVTQKVTDLPALGNATGTIGYAVNGITDYKTSLSSLVTETITESKTMDGSASILLVDATAGDVDITIPSTLGAGFPVQVIKTDPTSNLVTVLGDVGVTVPSDLSIDVQGWIIKLISTTEDNFVLDNQVLQDNISLGDFDISATNETADVSAFNSLPVGSIRKVSWFGGDGSNNFSFTNASGVTLDGIPFTDWVGEGTGNLNIRKIGTDEWQTYDVDVWDKDGGNFAGGANKFSKSVNGVLWQKNQRTISAYPTPSTFSISYAETPPKTMNAARVDGVMISFNLLVNPISTTTYDIYVYNLETSTQVTNGLYSWILPDGKWTTGTPRRK